MKINDDHLFHGAALLQIAEHPQFTAIHKFVTKTGSARSTFLVNTGIGIYLKYRSTATKGKYREYTFNFSKTHLAEVEELASKVPKTFIPLICIEERQICCISVEQLRELIQQRRNVKGTDEATYTILATLPKWKQFRAYVNYPGTKGTRAGDEIKIPRNSFPDVLFE
jgi:hypothetical protein